MELRARSASLRREYYKRNESHGLGNVTNLTDWNRRKALLGWHPPIVIGVYRQGKARSWNTNDFRTVPVFHELVLSAAYGHRDVLVSRRLAAKLFSELTCSSTGYQWHIEGFRERM